MALAIVAIRDLVLSWGGCARRLRAIPSTLLNHRSGAGRGVAEVTFKVGARLWLVVFLGLYVCLAVWG